MLDIEGLTIKELREVARLASTLLGAAAPCATASQTAIVVGQRYLFQTVTLYFEGKVTNDLGTELILSEVSCVYETGPLATAIKTAKFTNSEALPGEMILLRAGLIGVFLLVKP